MPNPSRKSVHGRVHRAASGFATLAVSLTDGVSAAEAKRSRRTAISTAMKDIGPVVYGVLTTDGLIKFGYSTNLPNRLYAYGIGVHNAKRLLMVRSGSLVDEQIIHERFARHVAHGREFFYPVREIFDYINSVRQEMGVPPIRI